MHSHSFHTKRWGCLQARERERQVCEGKSACLICGKVRGGGRSERQKEKQTV